MNAVGPSAVPRSANAGRRRARREALEAWAFILPSTVLLLAFGLLPVLFATFVSLHKWRITPGGWLGLGNYVEAFGGIDVLVWVAVFGAVIAAGARVATSGTPSNGRRITSSTILAIGAIGVLAALPRIWKTGDGEMLDSLRVTVWYSIGTVPVQLALGLLLAVALDARFRGKQLFRVLFLLPYVVPAVASAAVFERLFSLRPESFANQLIALWGSPPQQWLRETRGILEMALGWGRDVAADATPAVAYWLGWARGPSLALVSVMFFNYWVFIGYYALIYANGLASIPKELYEAAEVDGASRRATFFRLIVPLLSPTTYFLSTLGIIGTFKAFNHIYVLRNPDAQGAADPISVYVFFTFFRKSRFGYAAAVALVLFAIVMGLTYLQRRFAGGRIHYGDD
jgi:multiple sugar transport system permease protein